MASTATASCIRRPQRKSGSQYWPRLIDSAPPATAASVSPSMMACAAEMMACSPLPHSRFTVSPAVLGGRPPLMAATRPRYMSLASVWITLPKTAWPTSAGSTSARLTASRTTAAARSQGGTVARPPPNLPIPVRTPDRIITSGREFMTAPSHVQSAVDGPDLPGDVGRLIGRQERDYPGDLLGPAEPAGRDLAAYPVKHPVWHRGDHVGCDVARRHRVHGEPDPVPGWPLCAGELEKGFLGQRLRQAEQAGLGRGIVRLADRPGLADDRGHVDDPAGTALDHVLERRLGHEESAGQIDGDDPQPVLVAHLGHGLVDGDARVVDQDVAAAVVGAADVAFMQGGEAVRVLLGHGGEELLGRLVVPPVPGSHSGALLGHGMADGCPDAAGPAGHERHPLPELPCGFLVLRIHGDCHRAPFSGLMSGGCSRDVIHAVEFLFSPASLLAISSK